MKRLAGAFLALVLAGCDSGYYSEYEDLNVWLNQSYATSTPDIPYSLYGGDFTQGLVRLYRVIPPYMDYQLVEGTETYLEKGDNLSFRFRQPLAEGAYVLYSSLVAKRGGATSELLGSNRQNFFSVSLDPLTVTPPSLSIYTDDKTGVLMVGLNHPQMLPLWVDNPYKFYFQTAVDLNPGVIVVPTDPTGSPGEEWRWDSGAKAFFDLTTPPNVYKSLAMKAVVYRNGTPSAISELPLPGNKVHSFYMSLTGIKSGGLPFGPSNSLHTSQDTGNLIEIDLDMTGYDGGYRNLEVRIGNFDSGEFIKLPSSNFVDNGVSPAYTIVVNPYIPDLKKLHAPLSSSDPAAAKYVLVVSIPNYGFVYGGIYVAQ